MVDRKGELGKVQVDRGWSHQVAMLAEACMGAHYVTVRLFCEGLSLCDRGHFYRRDDTGFNVFCFAELEHAEQFKARFGGEFIAPKDRPRWPGARRR